MRREELIAFILDHKGEFERKYGVRKIGLFGSYARDEAGDGSDIDVVVELERPDMYCLVGVKTAIEEAFQHRVDIVRLREKMNVSLRRRIERDVIYV